MTSPPSIRIAASEKSGPAARFQVPNCTTSIARPSAGESLPKSPANQRACNSSSLKLRGSASNGRSDPRAGEQLRVTFRGGHARRLGLRKAGRKRENRGRNLDCIAAGSR